MNPQITQIFADEIETMKQSRGYTFAELLVVVAIITLMMAIVVPRFVFQQQGEGLRGAASEITAALRAARRVAITKRELRALALDIYSIPAEFVEMRWTGTTWAREGEAHQLADNVAVVAVTTPGWTLLDITRTDDVNLDGSEESWALPSATQTLFNPQVDSSGDPAATNDFVNLVYHLVKFNQTGTADSAVIYLWNVKDERREIPGGTTAQALSNIHTLGVPPGLVIKNDDDQQAFFSLPTTDSPADIYYYTLVVNPITGGVKVYDYAWGTGASASPDYEWDRKKDGES